ncbi:MAG: DEAD/DEAH box helicase, partial [Planctomycetales bacterium]|nr:DEAD/DEAH box helicase [Planctomycetales bacterium]
MATSYFNLDSFHPCTRDWFGREFRAPTEAQMRAWHHIHRGENTLLLAPTGSGKTLAAFLVAIDRIMFAAGEKSSKGVRTLYISPLKALGVDVERNLSSPLAGICAIADRDQIDHHVPSVAVRSGDTPSDERRRITKQPPDILITTPESLYLLLTSQAREILTSVDTVIIDEIHSLVGNKRGSHLFVSLERLEWLRTTAGNETSLQRIGLSATQRPLDEIARLLGGSIATADQDLAVIPRPVEIVEAGRRKQIDLRIEVPVEDMAKLNEPIPQSGNAPGGPTIPSIWPAIHPRLVELIRQHRSTMIFVNSRRLAERLALAVNELAGEEIALAHHGSLAKDTRACIEDRLKCGTLPAIMATSSLELGIDMGAVDLVIQIEAPPTIASGIQRIGRANHHVDGQSSGVIIPKFRGDLLACSAAAERIQNGEVEETFYPRNPLDVLAQQIVAMVSLESRCIDEIYQTIRCAAPFADLTRSSFESVLDLLSGRYPSHEFSELRPRLNWDRTSGEVSPRRGTQRLAIVNAGTIPDRGLYGVFLSDGEGGSRVGELDEEMVFETHPGDVFLLGASSWRVIEITSDRVLVVPAPGEPGRMPFWHGDGPGRPLEFGKAIGRLSRLLLAENEPTAKARLGNDHALDPLAANNLLRYLHDQQKSTGKVPSDTAVVVECFLDEIGDWRVCVLTPFGARVHAPWAMAVASSLRDESARDVDMMWADDGI